VKSKIPGFNRIKTGLFIPFWLADLHFYGLEYGEGKKGCFWGPGFFLGEAGAGAAPGFVKNGEVNGEVRNEFLYKNTCNADVKHKEKNAQPDEGDLSDLASGRE